MSKELIIGMIKNYVCDQLKKISGAKCEAKTFDGERCLYAALSDSIRKLLRSYKMITSTTMRRDMYDEFLRR